MASKQERKGHTEESANREKPELTAAEVEGKPII